MRTRLARAVALENMSRKTRKTIHFGTPLATMFAEHLASGIPMSSLDPEEYVQFRVPRNRRNLEGSLLREDIKATKKYLLRVTIFTVILAFYIFLGSLLFFYVEQCVQKESKINYYIRVESRKILKAAFSNVCQRINSSGTFGAVDELLKHSQTDVDDLKRRLFAEDCLSTLINFSQPIPESWPTKCELTLLEFVKWMHFVAATCFTIGYGDVVPTSDRGKILTIVYACIGIPLSIAAYTYAAKFTVGLVSVLIEATHTRALKHKSVAGKQFKVFLVTLLLLVLLVCGASIMSSSKKLDNLSVVDSFYFWFCTLTTIGYGDITFKLENYLANHPWLTIFLAFLVLFGLGLVATVVSSFFRLLEVNHTKEKARQSSCLSQLCCRRKQYELERAP